MGIPSIDHSNDKAQEGNSFRIDVPVGNRPERLCKPEPSRTPTTIVRIAARLASCFYSQNEKSAADL
jgi:hypothetical protein